MRYTTGLRRALLPLTVASSLAAAPIEGLFNTGVSDGGALLRVGEEDPHYALEGGGVLKVMAPGSEWVRASNNATWIGVPTGGAQLHFESRFTLPQDADLKTVVLRGKISSTSDGQIFLNGWLINGPWECCSPQFHQLWAFEIDGDMKFPYSPAPPTPFLYGENVLAFWVAGTESRVLLVTDLEGKVYPTGRPFVRGDANADGQITIADPIRILTYLFAGSVTLPCEDAADVSDDGTLNIGDAISLLGYLFLGTLPPPSPFPKCGADDRLDDLGCERYSGCRSG